MVRDQQASVASLTWCTSHLRISVVARWALANRRMIDRIAVGSTATGISSAWVQAELVDARPVKWTVVVLVTFG